MFQDFAAATVTNVITEAAQLHNRMPSLTPAVAAPTLAAVAMVTAQEHNPMPPLTPALAVVVLVIVRRTIMYKEKQLIVPLYKAIVRPHLEYCIQACRPYRKKDIDKLERIQRRATKMIPELKDLSYDSRLSQCGLTTPETRRLR